MHQHCTYLSESVSQSVRKELFASVSQSEKSSLRHGALLLYRSSYFLRLSLIPIYHPKLTLTRVSISRISWREMNVHVSFSSRFSKCWENISSQISQSVSPKGALCVSQSVRKELFTSWCAIIIQKQLLFEIVTHPNISSQADLDKSLDLKNLLKRNECSCLVLLSIFKMLRKHFKFVPCFSSCEKLHFWRSEVSSPPPPFSTLGEIFRMKDEILKLRPMGVDGCLMTGAIQDHFVGFRLMTILAGQSYISEVNIFCCDVKAEEQIINYLWLILLSTLRDFLLLLQYSLSPLEIVERCLRLFFLLSKLSKEQYFSLFESWENFVWFLFLFSRKEIHISLSPLKNGEIVFKFLILSVE